MYISYIYIYANALICVCVFAASVSEVSEALRALFAGGSCWLLLAQHRAPWGLSPHRMHKCPSDSDCHKPLLKLGIASQQVCYS